MPSFQVYSSAPRERDSNVSNDTAGFNPSLKMSHDSHSSSPGSFLTPQESNVVKRTRILPRAIILMGVSGCGKSTLATALYHRFLSVPHPAHLIEGDTLHPDANIAKMRAGSPLSDEDRIPWLGGVVRAINQCGPGLCFVACSALKRVYRDEIVKGVEGSVVFIHLQAPFDVLYARMRTREHFMPPALLRSQYNDLQPPVPPEMSLDLDASREVGQLTQQAAEHIISTLE